MIDDPAIDTGEQGESWSPPPADESAGPNAAAPQQQAAPQGEAAIPDVGPAPLMARQTVGQGMSQLGQTVGRDISQGWENAKNSGPARLLGRAAGMVTGQEPDPAGGQTAQGDPLTKMLAGENALSPDVLDKVISQAPGSTQSNKLVNAIHQAREEHGDDASAAVLAGARVKYQTTAAFARTALMGANGKPADLNAAIKAANQAQEMMPDGSNTMFSPGGHGMVIAVSQLPGSHKSVQFNLSTQQFSQFLDVGKDGQFDKMMDVSAPATLQRLASAGSSPAGAPQTQARAGQAPQAQQPWKPGVSTDEASTNERQDQAVDKFKAVHPSKNPYGAPHAQSLDAFPGNDMAQAGNTPQDNAVDTANRKKGLFAGDQEAIPGTHDDQGHYLGPQERNKTNYGEEAEARSTALVGKGNVGREGERQHLMQTQENVDAERQAKVDAAAEKGRSDNERARITAGGRVATAQVTGTSRENAAATSAAAKKEGWQFASKQKADLAMAKLAQAERFETNKDKRAAIANMRSVVNNNRQTGTALSEDQNTFLKQLGIETQQAMAPQAPTPQARTPQAPAPQAQQPNSKDQQAMAWARANPQDPRAAQILQRLNGAQ